MTGFDEEFQRYFRALDRASGKDYCYLCRRSAAEVKAFFGFNEDGIPTNAAEFGLEDVVLERTDIMSYRGLRPVCAVCQLNLDSLFALDEGNLLQDVIRQVRDERDLLWPGED